MTQENSRGTTGMTYAEAVALRVQECYALAAQLNTPASKRLVEETLAREPRTGASLLEALEQLQAALTLTVKQVAQVQVAAAVRRRELQEGPYRQQLLAEAATRRLTAELGRLLQAKECPSQG